MDRADGSIKSSYGGGVREDFLFTYSEEEKQQNEVNKNNSQLILNPKYIMVSPAMIRAGYSYLEAILYGFIDFFLAHNERFYCTNEQLGCMLGVSEKTISLAINRLAKDGLIEVSYKIKSGGGKVRFLKNVMSDFTKMLCPTLQKCNGIDNKIIENKIIEKHVSDFSLSTNTDDSQNQKEERQRRSTKPKRKDYPADFEELWKVYPQNGGRKGDIYKFWCEYSEEEHDQFLWGAKVVLLYWDYVRHDDVRMSQRMDRWMEGYVAKDKKEQLLDIITKLTTITDNDVKNEGIAKAKELYGEDYVRRALIQCSKDIVLDFH